MGPLKLTLLVTSQAPVSAANQDVQAASTRAPQALRWAWVQRRRRIIVFRGEARPGLFRANPPATCCCFPSPPRWPLGPVLFS